MKRLKVVLIDALILAAFVTAFALYQFVLPQPYAEAESTQVTASAPSPSPMSEATSAAEKTVTTTEFAEEAEATAVNTREAVSIISSITGASGSVPSATASATATPEATATDGTSSDLGGGKFSAKFTEGDVISTATSYVSENVNVTLTRVQQDGVTYYVEDIYIRNITNLRTAFANNTYGRSIVDWPLNMAVENNAIAAINGDYYGVGTIGLVIRNGELYSSRVDGEVLVLFYDGTMQVYELAEFDANAVMAAGAYQAWSFGPSLLSEDGQALSGFRGGISGLNPRTAIGYYEPGHYVFVVVDGRQEGYSNGASLDQLAALMESLGVQVAYNLDGGKTSQMTFGDALVNQPTQGGRMTSDIIYIGE